MSLLKIALFISDTLLFATPLLFTALGGMFTEKAGVTNIGLEGMMTIGAFAGAAVGYFTKSALLGFLAGGIAASLVALIHAIVSITFGADQVVSGIAINFIGPGVALFICSLLFDSSVSGFYYRKTDYEFICFLFRAYCGKSRTESQGGYSTYFHNSERSLEGKKRKKRESYGYGSGFFRYRFSSGRF